MDLDKYEGRPTPTSPPPEAENLDVIHRSQASTTITSRLRQLASQVRTSSDSDWREYRRLVKTDKTYNPVKAYKYEEAVKLGLVGKGPSLLDQAYDQAPTQEEADAGRKMIPTFKDPVEVSTGRRIGPNEET